ncbi:Por secretion system C-terminal sorting domain-containing protein [Ekhidna lutea]|uniref:Por secretion system C-terminal sorting domain-containing protein n=1 Tax=Ekhidna lutea TaxID=447679 RepID=A0A239H7C7_EKHLU|nr:T9SS type A sorting domain-containing protein [Ekhidna lutea]SNS77346.1 Por secretion system C-terminal sorting domain-containing protein [Ekhidna lutea]
MKLLRRVLLFIFGLFLFVGLSAQSPGDVSTNLELWLKADAGVEEAAADAAEDGDAVLNWLDQSPSGNDVSQATAAARPTFNTGQVAGYPSIIFSTAGTDDFLEGGNVLNYVGGTDNWSVFAVWNIVDGESGTIISRADNGTGANRQWQFYSSGDEWRAIIGGTTNDAGAIDVTGDWTIASSIITTTAFNSYVLGVNDQSTAGIGTASETTNIRVGARGDGAGGEGFTLDGSIAEIIMYGSNLSASDQRNVESYLALKYGVTLDISGADPADAYTVGGVEIFNHSAYSNDIAGIALDNSQGLNQTSTISTNADAILTVSNASDLQDNEFFMWGNDNGALSSTTSNVPAGVDARVNRIWRVDESADVGTIDLSFDTSPTGFNNTSTFYLIVSPNTATMPADLSTGTTYTGTYSNGTVTFSGVNIGDGEFFTLGATTPSGIAPGDSPFYLKLWLKADKGVTQSSNSVSTWADQSGNNNDASQGTSAAQPTLDTEGLNGNPSLIFDGADDVLAGGSGFYTHDYFLIINPNEIYQSTDGDEAIIGWDGVDFSGVFFGDHTGQLTDEVLTHSVAADNYRSGIESTTQTFSDPVLINFRNNAAANDQELYLNGALTTTTTPNAFSNLFDEDYIIGSNGVGGDIYDGQISEIISYGARLSDTERRDVSSYLAIKYGLTLDITSEDYTAGGVIIYDRTTHGAYDSDIAGIGRDDSQGLNQTSSQSINDGSIVSMGNPGSLGEGDFLVWGNDGGSLDITTSDVPGGVTNRLTRIWRVDETGVVGTVDVSFDVSEVAVDFNSTFNLLIAGSGATMPTGLSGASVSSAGTVSTVNGRTIVTFENILFNDNEYFTLGGNLITEAPGDQLTNLELWLKADEGIVEGNNNNNVREWTDRSGNGHSAKQVDPNDEPTYIASYLNGNPALEFDENDDDLYSQTGFYTQDYFIVLDPNQDYVSTSAVDYIIGWDDDDISGLQFGAATGFLTDEVLTHYQDDANNYISGVEGATIAYTDPMIINFRENVTANDIELYINGLSTTVTTPNAFLAHFNNVSYRLGQSGEEADPYDGYMMELICFSARSTDANRREVASYLAIKYGITLDITTQNYTAGGVTIYDRTTHGGYSNDIAGIGQDDSQGLDQTTSQSVNNGSLLQMSSASSQDDGDFLVWGNDGAALTINSADVPGGAVTDRLERIWRADETNEVGTVDVVFDLTTLPINVNTSTFNLLVHTTTTMASATPSAAGTVSTVNGRTIVTFSGVNFNDNDYFTLGGSFSSVTGPGDQGTNLALWLKANEGPVLNGSLIEEWADKSGNGNSAKQPAVDEQPTLLSSGLNGNEVVDFNGTNGALKAAAGFSTNEYFVVVDPKQTYTSVSGDDCVIGLNHEDFNGMTFGDHTGFLTDEVLTHAFSDATDYRIGVTGTTISYREPMIVNFRDNGAATGMELYIDGTLTTVTTPNAFTAHYNDVMYSIGSNAEDGDAFDGRVAEVISYSALKTAAQRRDIATYLAIKYGLTIDITSQNYTVMGASIYDRTTHGAYDSNIAGIGQDDSQALDQTSSLSEELGGLVTIGNASSQDDGDFLVWGNDGGSTALTASTRTGLTNRVTRIWRADHTNNVGTVDVTYDLTELGFSPAASYELLIAQSTATMPADLDNDAVTSITTGSTSTVNGRNYVAFTGVTINDDEYFTLAGNITEPGPGGVATNLTLWLKANEGVSESSNAVFEWLDHSGSGNHALQGQDAFKPTLTSSAINSNEAISFDVDYMTGDAGFYTREMFVVVDPDFLASAAEDAGTIIGYEAGDFGALELGPSSASLADEIISHTQSAGGGYVSADTDGTGTVVYESPMIINDRLNAGLNGQDIILNGVVVDDTEVTAVNHQNFDNVGYQLGYPFDFSDGLEGTIAEVISYSSKLSDADRRDVATYLAIKYGITLDISGADPFDAYTVGGTHVYDDTAYPNDIAGIGKNETTQGLNQTTSQSVNDGSIVKVSTASSLDDGDYFIWGNDGASNTLTTANVPTGTVERLNKIWKVDETGDVGTVTISFDITSFGVDQSNSTVNLVVSPSTATMPTDLATGTLITGGTFSTVAGKVLVTFTDVDFADGDYFTIAGDIQTTSPGGISSGLSVWFKANEGVEESSNLVSSWVNLGAGESDASQGDNADKPTLVNNSMNFNPALDFDGDFLDGTSGFYTDDYFVVIDTDAQLNNISTNGYVIGFESGQASGLFLGAGASGVTNEIITHIAEGPGTYRAALNNGSTYDLALIVNSRNNAGATAQDLVVDGTEVTEAESGTFGQLDDQFFRIGNDFTSSSTFNGKISEVISYNARLSDADRRDVASYLAIKYGITLDISGADPFDAYTVGGVHVYDNTTFAENIAGIGANLDHGLSQPKSESQNVGAIVRMQDASSLGSGDYIVWGKNTASNSTLQTSELAAGYDQRLAAEWQVDVTGTPGTVTVRIYGGDIDGFNAFPTNPAGFTLLIDDDSDFSADLVSEVTGSSMSGDTIIFTGVSFSDNYYFTFAVPNPPAPGDVGTNLSIWLKADDGITESASMISDWTDQSGNNNDAAQGASDSRPTLISNSLNGNPLIDFDGTNDYMDGISGAGFYTHDYFVVMQPDNTMDASSSVQAILGYASGNDNGLFFGTYSGTIVNEVLTHAVGTYERADNTALASYSTSQIINSRNNAGATAQEIFVDEVQVDDASALGAFANQSNVDYIIGDRYTTGQAFDGKVAEVISYSARLSNADRRDVASYLAIKYGITLDISGADPFDAYTVAAAEVYNYNAYSNDIAGIGLNASQDLSQSSSTSINPDAIVTMDNATSLSDGDYVVWGNDDGLTTTTGVLNLPAGVTERMIRIWGVNETGNAGNVRVTMDLTGLGYGAKSASDFLLIVDNDADFTNGVLELAPATSFTSDVVVFSGINFTGATNFGLGTGSDFVTDSDGDGIPDYFEVAKGSDPNDVNSPVADGNLDDNVDGGTPNQGMNDTGINGDGITDALEQLLITSGATGPISKSTDTDGDGIPDYLEVRDGTDPFDSDQPTTGGAADSDGDGIPDAFEVYIANAGGAADPALDTDTDGDGVPDYYEVLNDNDPNDVNDPTASGGTDSDGDGLSDAMEQILIDGGATAPVNATTDTDADGIPDYIEALTNTDAFNDADPFASGTPNVRSLQADYTVSGASCVSISGYQWIDVSDNLGNIVFSINPVGNNLSSTCWGVRIVDPTDDNVRDNTVDYVLDRNWYITPTIQPSNSMGVYIRFYALAEEHTDLGDELLSAESFTFDEEAHLRITKITGVANSLDPFIAGGTRINLDPEVQNYSTNGKSLTIGISSFSSFAPHTTPSGLNDPLPIELIEFKASILDQYVVLDWSTATEINNDYFTIERSRDGEHFDALENIDGAGDSNERLDYQYTDKKPFLGVNYYRLKQTDYDGTQSHSEAVLVVFEGPSQLVINVYPNPIEDKLFVSFSSEFNVGTPTIRMVDLKGQEIAIWNIATDDNLLEIDLNGYPEGVYLLQMEVGNRTYSHTLVKK